NGRVVRADEVEAERRQTNRCVVGTGGETEESKIAFGSVVIGITPVRRGDNRLRSWQEREAEKRQCDEKLWSCFELNQWIHGSAFLFPARLILRLRVRKRRRTWRGERSSACFESVLMMAEFAL